MKNTTRPAYEPIPGTFMHIMPHCIRCLRCWFLVQMPPVAVLNKGSDSMLLYADVEISRLQTTKHTPFFFLSVYSVSIYKLVQYVTTAFRTQKSWKKACNHSNTHSNDTCPLIQTSTCAQQTDSAKK